ncbi:MAG TPA: hypothetical protein VMS64_18600 [Candidatus Methylomirabilis sp.]|nr:hypothetical protein [Candidatus Methylomirabilis sp.]
MSKPLLLVNLLLVAVAIFFGVTLARDLARSQSLPTPPAPRKVQGPTTTEDAPAPPPEDKLVNYNVIVAKHLFNPARTEGAAAPAPPAPPLPPKPMLLGVVVDPDLSKSRAYLEEATTKRVLGYKIGDSVAGGRLDQITDDKVVIVRPDGAVDVLLRDPSKPKPLPNGAPGAPGATGPQPGGPIPPGVTPPGVVPQARPGEPPIVPRALRRVPVDQPPQPGQQ